MSKVIVGSGVESARKAAWTADGKRQSRHRRARSARRNSSISRLSGSVQTLETLLLRKNEKIDIFAKLGSTVEHTGLAAHKQRLNLMFLDRKKDLSDRGRDQGYLP